MKVAVNASHSKRKNSAAYKTEAATADSSRQRSIVGEVKTRQKKFGSTLVNKNGGKDIGEVQNVKMRQLFSIIDTFYCTLCDLPLQKLISSSEPQNWIAEQGKTLSELCQKLGKWSKTKEYEYYNEKLQSVGTILSNIGDNMSMLNRITTLRNYGSGTQSSSYVSRSSSCQSEGRLMKLGDFVKEESSKQMLSYDQYVIENGHQHGRADGTRRSPDMKAETIYSEEESSEQEEVLAQSQVMIGVKSAKIQRPLCRYGENYNISNLLKPRNVNSKVAQSQVEDSDLKDKTMTKTHKAKADYSQRTLSNFEGERRFMQDRALPEVTSRASVAKRDCCVSRTLQVSKECDASDSKGSEYIELIKQLRLQLMSKDKEIENLLINEQSYQQSMQLMREREKEKSKQILFLKESLSIGVRERERLQGEMKKIRQHEEELKETIRIERDRIHKEEMARQHMQSKYSEQMRAKEELQEIIERLTEQKRVCRKNERVMKQKLQIYTKRYFSLYSELQSKREECQIIVKQMQKQRNRGRGVSKYDEIRNMVQLHKEKLIEDDNY